LNLSDICIFTRSYRGDIEFLPYLYKSVEKYCSTWGDVVLVVEEDDEDLIKKIIPPWVKLCVEEHFATGSIQHKYSKLTADLYTNKDFIFHIDSDSIFTTHASISDLAIDNKPYLEYSSYEHLLSHQNSPDQIRLLKTYCKDISLRESMPMELKKIGVSDVDHWMRNHYDDWLLNNFEGWFSDWHEDWKNRFGVDLWRAGISNAIGFDVPYEFSRRPEKLYPRSMYSHARHHLESRFNMPVKNFIATRVGRQTNDVSKNDYFSDLNYLGAYLYYFMNEKIEWLNVELKGYSYRKEFVKQFISFDHLSDGVLRPESKKLLDSYF
jgi:hypothetical protein